MTQKNQDHSGELRACSAELSSPRQSPSAGVSPSPVPTRQLALLLGSDGDFRASLERIYGPFRLVSDTY